MTEKFDELIERERKYHRQRTGQVVPEQTIKKIRQRLSGDETSAQAQDSIQQTFRGSLLKERRSPLQEVLAEFLTRNPTGTRNEAIHFIRKHHRYRDGAPGGSYRLTCEEADDSIHDRRDHSSGEIEYCDYFWSALAQVLSDAGNRNAASSDHSVSVSSTASPLMKTCAICGGRHEPTQPA